MGSDSVPLPVRVRSAELAQLRADAKAKGLSLAEHVRRKLGLPPPVIGRPPAAKPIKPPRRSPAR